MHLTSVSGGGCPLLVAMLWEEVLQSLPWLVALFQLWLGEAPVVVGQRCRLLHQQLNPLHLPLPGQPMLWQVLEACPMLSWVLVSTIMEVVVWPTLRGKMHVPWESLAMEMGQDSKSSALQFRSARPWTSRTGPSTGHGR